MLLESAQYSAEVGRTKEDKPWGWRGIVDFAFHFDAYLTPISS
jgi:hypothetical protein